MTTPLEYWEGLENKKGFIRNYGEGVGTQSRRWLLSVVKDGESLLDVGCGPGCTYENLKTHERQIQYKGIDFASGFINVCQELFPEAIFEVGDAMALNEPDGAWDTVLLRHVLEHVPYYEQPIAKAMRVAKRRVIIVMWRPLFPGSEDRIHINEDFSNDYGREKFLPYLESFRFPVSNYSFPGPRPNWAWVIHKVLDQCVFDLDDLKDDAPDIDLLFKLKEQYPNLKVTLFAIPAYTSPDLLARFAGLDWVELAVHGWTHHPNQECLEWDRDTTARYLDKTEKMGFVKGFRPPGWLMSDAVLDELAYRDYWVACHWNDRKRAEDRKMRTFLAHNNPFSVHGHFQFINSNNWLLRNGLRQLVEERGLPWDDKTHFQLISEVAR